jgi:hypothetical protein
MALQKVENVYTSEKVDISSVYTMAIGDEIKYYQMPSFNDANFLNSSLSHLWSFFNMRTETDYNVANQPYANGGLLGTALENLPEAFYNVGAIGFSITNENYRVQVYGQNEALYVPLNSSYTGMTSGLTATTLYSSFIYNPDILKKNPFSLCSGVQADEYKSEASAEYTNNFGIGYQYAPGKNPNPASNYKFFDSGVVYLMSNNVSNTFTGATGSSLTWDYLYNNTNKFANGARLISFEPGNTQYTGIGGYDRIVGAMFLNYGFGFIFDPDLVKGFDWSTVNGDPTSITGGTFTSGQTAFDAADMDLAEILNVKIVAPPNVWTASPNSSYIGTGQDCGIATTTITLHSTDGSCLAIVKPDEALIKNQDGYLIFDLELPLSEPITPQDGTLIWDGVSPL